MENNEIEVVEEKTGIEEVTDFTTDNPIYVETKKELKGYQNTSIRRSL